MTDPRVIHTKLTKNLQHHDLTYSIKLKVNIEMFKLIMMIHDSQISHGFMKVGRQHLVLMSELAISTTA